MHGKFKPPLSVCPILALPGSFAVAEIMIGLMSLATGILSIPPLIGLGTAIDAGILTTGLVILAVYAVGGKKESSLGAVQGDD